MFAIDASERKMAAAMAHVWPVLAFVVGMLLASHIRTGRASRIVSRPLPHSYVTVPISFLAAVQIGLFRRIGDLAYVPVATTGNLMRFMEAAYDGFVDRQPASRRATGVYAAVIASFASGALVGAVATDSWGTYAIWTPAAVLATALSVFVVGQRRRPFHKA